MCEYEIIKGDQVESGEIEKETMRYFSTNLYYHCLVIINVFWILLDTVPTNMACSTLSTAKGALTEKREGAFLCNAQCVMSLFP